MTEQPPDPRWSPPTGPPPSAPPPGYGQQQPQQPAYDPYSGYGGQQQQQPQFGYQQYGYQQQSTSTNGFAIAALVLGIVWIWWVGSLLAVIFGHIAMSQIKNSGGRQTGNGMAIAGLVLGYIGLAVLVVLLIVGAASGFE